MQLLKYSLKIWETNVKQYKKLIPVIPVILYLGKDKWNVHPFNSYFSEIDEDLKKYIPEINYVLADLSDFSDEEILNGVFKNVTTKIASLLMKNIFNEQKLLKNLVDFLNIGALYFKEENG